MKKDLAAVVLVGALVASALLATWCSVRYYFSLQELQDLQARYVAINNVRNAAQALANEAVEYSQRNPAIEPVLQQFDIRLKPATNAAPASPIAQPPAP